MAKKSKKALEITPLMGLSMLAIFIMMPVIFLLSNSEKAARTSYAVATPSPSAVPVNY